MHKRLAFRSAFGAVKPVQGRRVSHEQAAREIEEAGKRHAASADSARAFLTKIGILDASTGKLSKDYR